jgi:bifunctional non-homologous end joining protein LigD
MSKLSAYTAKRDFQKTAEPSGEDPVRPSKALRFVVQRHDATRLHYDLRLELDGVFKSWAVTKGPSLDPSDKRLAVEVEDHPLGYGDFEGTIPKGQYGGGTVQLFDRGTWQPETEEPPERSLAKGELKFRLDGQRLKGSFVLVRLKADRTRGKRTNWLLIKHRDSFAHEGPDGGGVLAVETSVASGRDLATIAAGKGRKPKAFMLAADKAPARNAVWDSTKGLAKAQRDGVSAMPDFIEPQLCRVASEPPKGKVWLHEIKLDGYRILARVAKGVVTLRTRGGLDWTDKFATIAKALKDFPDAILDGEIVALDAQGLPDFSALQAAIADRRTENLVYFIFDLLFHDGSDLRAKHLKARKSALEHLLSGHIDPHLRYVEHFEADGGNVLKSAKDLGVEGIVSKDMTSVYHSGRSEAWIKTKCRATDELVLGGWTQVDGTLRALLGGVFRDGKLTYVGRIGTGFGARTLAKLMPALEANAASRSPFDAKGAPPRDRTIRWLKPNLVANVEFAGWSTDGIVRQAAFKGLREDKPAQTVIAESPVAPDSANQRKAAAASVKPEAVKRAAGTTIKGIKLSHPDKVLWPDSGDETIVTKRDLAGYFEVVADWMLPHITGRPCSIIRAPDGIDGQTFFQRHALPGGSGHFKTIQISGEREPYLVIETAEALVAVAQSGGLELHPSNCAPDQPDVPGRLVFDLDPAPDVAFSEVVAAAKLMKETLEAIGLVTFCKTTGGKGLHVVTPLDPSGPKVDWATAKQFAHEICLRLERAEPKRFVTNMSKAARTGRIFLDYLRNDLLSTAVAPLSPRARPHAPISMPLTWAQVRADLDPLRYNLRSVPKLLSRSKAWADYDAAAKPLKAAIDALQPTSQARPSSRKARR